MDKEKIGFLILIPIIIIFVTGYLFKISKKMKDDTIVDSAESDTKHSYIEEIERVHTTKIQETESESETEPIIYEGWTVDNINIRKEPSSSSESEIIGTLSFNTYIQYTIYNQEWLCINYLDQTAYVNSNYISENKIEYRECNIDNNNTFKSYMPYNAINDRTSLQYKLQQYAYTGDFGIRTIDNRYLIAIGTAFNANVGTYVDLILTNGEIIPCVVGDIKADKDTLADNITTMHNGCVSEFICEIGLLPEIVKSMGDISYCKQEWNSPVIGIKVYEKNFFKMEE